MGTKSDLKVVKNTETGEIDAIDPKVEPKKPTKAELKKQEKERKAEEKRQAIAQQKAMELQIKNMHEAVQGSICKSCIHCGNRETKVDQFKVTSSKGTELFCPMNWCKLAGLSLVDVKTCEMHEEVKNG